MSIAQNLMDSNRIPLARKVRRVMRQAKRIYFIPNHGLVCRFSDQSELLVYMSANTYGIKTWNEVDHAL